jgi:hypothetical protein
MKIILWVIVLIEIGFFFALSQKFLWWDERFSIEYAQKSSFYTLISRSGEISHPPGMYVLYKFLLEIPVSSSELRFVHFIIFIITIVLVKDIFKRLELSYISQMMGLIFWVSSGYIFHFIYQLRMYSWGILFMLLSVWLTLRLEHRKSLFISVLTILVDLMGVLFVYGYIFWPLIRLLALSLNRSSGRFRLGPRFIIYLLALVALSLYMLSPLQQIELIHNHYIDWVKPPAVSDLFSMTASLLGNSAGIYLQEGYNYPKPLVFFVEKLVLVMLFDTVAQLLSAVVLSVCSIQYIRSHFSGLAIMRKLYLSALSIFLIVFILSSLFNLHFFHIRQFFVFAVMFHLAIVPVFVSTHLGKIGIIVFVFLTYLNALMNYLMHVQAFPYS